MTPARFVHSLRVGGGLALHVEPTLRDACLVIAFEGWNDAGEAATHAVQFLETSLASASLAEIDGEDFLDFTVQRPRLHSRSEAGWQIEWPDLRFRYASLAAEREVVLARGPEPHLRWRGFCDLVAELVSRFAVRRVALLGAYLAEVVYSRPVGIAGFASDPPTLEKLNVTPSSYEGPTGIVAVLADRLRAEGAEVLSLWAGLPHYINATPNPRGSLALLQKLGEWLELPLDLEPLEREAGEFEERVSALVAADPQLGEYIRQLKRREFTQ